MTPPTDRQVSGRLLAWLRREKRRLPWRGTREPYRIWVSEVMLQQTTVEAVRRRYALFLRRFPTLAALARAPEDAVLAAWSGLGYYARARNLHRAAREIVRRHRGRIPREPAILRTLPGFGPYTASAVAALAFGERTPAADANVTRVTSRLFAIPGALGTPRLQKAVLRRVESLLPRRRPGDLLAAMMDLGQQVCLSRAPRCAACPMRDVCIARSRGVPERFPLRRSRPRPERVRLVAAVVEREGRALLRRRADGYLRGLWEFPSRRSGPDPRKALSALEGELPVGRVAFDGRPIATVRHAIVGYRLTIDVFRGTPAGSVAAVSRDGTRWFSPQQLSRAAIPTLTRKVAASSGFLERRFRRILPPQ